MTKSFKASVILNSSYRLMYLPFDEASVPDFLTLQKANVEKFREIFYKLQNSD